MPTYKNTAPFPFDFPGDGTRPAVTVEPDGTVVAETNPNGMYFVETDPVEPAVTPEATPPAG
jgi:hypothetical protein